MMKSVSPLLGLLTLVDSTPNKERPPLDKCWLVGLVGHYVPPNTPTSPQHSSRGGGAFRRIAQREAKRGGSMSVWLPQHLSVSSVELYARCPAQWKRRYVDRIIDPPNRAMAWGTAFHKALETVHLNNPAVDYELAWLKTWNDMREVVGPMFGPSKSHGIDLLDGFHARGLDVECPAEVKFTLPFPSGNIPVPLLGYVDAFAPDDTREYKTTKGGWWNQLRADMSHQAHVYSWVRQRTLHHRRPVRFVIFGTRAPTITEYVVEPSPDGMRLFERLAEGVWDGIVNARYDGCGDCFVCKPGSTKLAADESVFDWDLT